MYKPRVGRSISSYCPSRAIFYWKAFGFVSIRWWNYFNFLASPLQGNTSTGTLKNWFFFSLPLTEGLSVSNTNSWPCLALSWVVTMQHQREKVGQNLCNIWSVRQLPCSCSCWGGGRAAGLPRGHKEQPSSPRGCGEPRLALGQCQCAQHLPGRVALVYCWQQPSCLPLVLHSPRGSWGGRWMLSWLKSDGGWLLPWWRHEGLHRGKFRVQLEMWEVLHGRSPKALQMAEVRNEEGPRILWRRGKWNWGLNIVGAESCGPVVMFDGLQNPMCPWQLVCTGLDPGFRKPASPQGTPPVFAFVDTRPTEQWGVDLKYLHSSLESWSGRAAFVLYLFLVL